MSGTVDRARLAEERAAVLELEFLLRSSGDDPTIMRAIDLRFVGRPPAVEALRAASETMGCEPVKLFEHEDGGGGLELRLLERTDPAALDKIVCWAVAAEAAYGVRYNGLTTCSQRGATPTRDPAGAQPGDCGEAAAEARNQDHI